VLILGVYKGCGWGRGKLLTNPLKPFIYPVYRGFHLLRIIEKYT